MELTKPMELMEKYQLIELWLDNDPGGEKCAVKALKKSSAYLIIEIYLRVIKTLIALYAGLKEWNRIIHL